VPAACTSGLRGSMIHLAVTSRQQVNLVATRQVGFPPRSAALRLGRSDSLLGAIRSYAASARVSGAWNSPAFSSLAALLLSVR
jgi:hypothetical protein